MADFSTVIQEINDDINTNGVGAITGAKLNEVLRDMISAVNAEKEDLVTDGYYYGGVINPYSTPSDDKRLFYITETAGIYTNFDGLEILNDAVITIIYWVEDGAYWNQESFGVTLRKVQSEIADRFKMLFLDLGFPLFSPYETYSVGDYVTKIDDGSLYYFTSPHQGVWDDDDVRQATLVDYIDGLLNEKADKVSNATSGNFAGLDANGNLTDSGLSVFDFFVMVEDASTPPASMAPNTVYQYGTLSGNTTFPPLATPTEPDIANVYCWTFSTPSTAPTITWPSAITSWAGGSAPTINASKSYEVSVMDGVATIIEA